MMRAIEEGKIDCIVVKDLSRFGREHVDVGKYLRQFTSQNIRFIAILDIYDNIKETSSDHLVVSMKNLFNATLS
jgi:site-specific DNA recombinase